MPVHVVDASALGALLFGEPDAEEVANALGDAPLAAPSLLWFELASICLKKIRAHPDRTEKLLSAFTLLDRLPVEAVAVDHAATVRLALERKVTTYDASYLWLARRLGGELVTLDRKLGDAALADRRQSSRGS